MNQTVLRRIPRWGWILLLAIPGTVLAQGVSVQGGGRILAGGGGWNLSGGEQGLELRWSKELITTYRTDDGPKPYFYPLMGATGEAMTRGFPMDPHPDESADHKHHRSLWFGHRDVNGIDFWSEPRPLKPGQAPLRRWGRIRHVATNGIQVGGGELTLRVRNRWEDDQGELVCEDRRTYRLERLENGDFVMDWDVTVMATAGDCRFGDNKDGTMAIRVIPSLRLKAGKERKDPGTGRILTSAGVRDGDAWGKRAKWVDYFGPDRKGNPVGVALFDHPDNLRHPTWWHARDYGLLAANPFGIHHFERQEEGAGDYVIKKDDSLRFRYRILLHQGKADAERLDEAWSEWAEEAE